VEQSELIVVAGMGLGEEFGVVETDAEGHCAEEFAGGLVAVPVKGVHEGAEAGDKGLGKPLVGLVGVVLAADFVAFLQALSVSLPTHDASCHLDVRHLSEFPFEIFDIVFVAHGIRYFL